MKLKLLLITVLMFVGAARAEEVNVAWNPNPEANIAKYTVMWGTEAGVYSEKIDVVPDAIADVDGSPMVRATLNLEPGATYFISVTATNNAQLESLPSSELQYSFLRPAQVSLPVVIRLKADGTWEIVTQ